MLPQQSAPQHVSPPQDTRQQDTPQQDATQQDAPQQRAVQPHAPEQQPPDPRLTFFDLSLEIRDQIYDHFIYDYDLRGWIKNGWLQQSCAHPRLHLISKQFTFELCQRIPRVTHLTMRDVLAPQLNRSLGRPAPLTNLNHLTLLELDLKIYCRGHQQPEVECAVVSELSEHASVIQRLTRNLPQLREIHVALFVQRRGGMPCLVRLLVDYNLLFAHNHVAGLLEHIEIYGCDGFIDPRLDPEGYAVAGRVSFYDCWSAIARTTEEQYPLEIPSFVDPGYREGVSDPTLRNDIPDEVLYDSDD